jgi:hypothetical protein
LREPRFLDILKFAICIFHFAVRLRASSSPWFKSSQNSRRPPLDFACFCTRACDNTVRMSKSGSGAASAIKPARSPSQTGAPPSADGQITKTHNQTHALGFRTTEITPVAVRAHDTRGQKPQCRSEKKHEQRADTHYFGSRFP